MVFSALLFMCSCIKDDVDEVENYVTVGMEVPVFTVDDGEGSVFSSEMFKGKQTLLVFFNTVCGDCAREIPKAEAVWQALKEDADYSVVAIGRKENKESMAAYWKDMDLTMPKYQDPDRSVFDMFANSTIPRFYIINDKGVVVWMGIENLGEDTEEDLIDKMMTLR